MKKEYTLKLGIAAKKPFQNSGLPLKSMECPITTRNENKNLKKSKLLLFLDQDQKLGRKIKKDKFELC